MSAKIIERYHGIRYAWEKAKAYVEMAKDRLRLFPGQKKKKLSMPWPIMYWKEGYRRSHSDVRHALLHALRDHGGIRFE